jgi:cytochrome c-type biogenesis protein CcmF
MDNLIFPDNYVGEHTLIGKFGHAMILLSFVAAVISAVAYFMQKDEEINSGWKQTGRWAFRIHSLTALAAIGILFYMMFNRFYEYHYVWKYSNSQMPLKYIFSCFWGGQEGSYLLWIFWHVVLGNFLLHRSKNWEAPVMTVFAGMQALILTMLLGIYFGDWQLGSSPFILSRETAENYGASWTLNANYMSGFIGENGLPVFSDGLGLNPLLQNYWMTIHPPTLFLGYSSTLIPFCYIIAALRFKKINEWIKPALSWTYFSVAALGLGILMGGAWAYESLSFGGFWAWDPVENASFVPWLVLVGGAHVMIAHNKSGKSPYSALFLPGLAFILVWYATFLTRSGVLGDASVHSFAGGSLGALLLFLLITLYIFILSLLQNRKLKIGFTVFSLLMALCFVFLGNLDQKLAESFPGLMDTGGGAIDSISRNTSWRGVLTLITILGVVVIMIKDYNSHFPRDKKEEELWSREFWLFIGSLILLLSAAQILVPTSIPVFNEVFGANIDPITDSVERNRFYNGWQVPFAFLVTLIIGWAQFLKYKNTPFKEFSKKLILPIVIALVCTFFIKAFIYRMPSTTSKDVLLFSSLFAVFANANYYIRVLKGKLNFAGASIAHIGFGLVVLGALISQGQQMTISQNNPETFELDYFNMQSGSSRFSNHTDVFVRKHDTVFMDRYFVLYHEKWQEGSNIYYNIDYFKPIAKNYAKGDTVKLRSGLFTALVDHKATRFDFEDNKLNNKLWEPIPVISPIAYNRAKTWNAYRPGEKLFTLTPMIQLNPQFGNVSEPGTKHYLTHDVFTYMKNADQTWFEPDDDYMDALAFTVKLYDTVITPNNIVVVEGIEGVAKSEYEALRLLPNDLVARVNMRVFNTNDRSLISYQASPLFILRDGELFIPDTFEVGDANVAISVQKITPVISGLDSITGLPIYSNETSVTFTLADKEYIVMQAIVFPWINILWIGSIIMTLGTIMAVVYRVRRK